MTTRSPMSRTRRWRFPISRGRRCQKRPNTSSRFPRILLSPPATPSPYPPSTHATHRIRRSSAAIWLMANSTGACEPKAQRWDPGVRSAASPSAGLSPLQKRPTARRCWRPQRAQRCNSWINRVSPGSHWMARRSTGWRLTMSRTSPRWCIMRTICPPRVTNR
ncbi:MAG: hypothetical protein BWY63_01561 [Chloroflexi bacterium ADurb.Bin360]|nr:MAG: hypothetical protein BWY63_01561 [Chloroflexi bacterium ADurb.Bin360]